MNAPEMLDRDLLRRFPLPHHPDDGDKEERGRILVIAGSRELAGAAYLAGIAGLRAGAGKLQIATAASIAVQLGIAIPEARVIGMEETEEGCLALSGIDALLGWAEGAQAIMIGCGLQHGPPLDALLDALLAAGLDRPLILDAAVLGSLAPRATALRAWPGGAIVLPHAREMARLLECAPEEVEADPLAAARTAAERFDVVALVKGQFSHVAHPDGRAFRFRGGGVGLATSGSGDTLAGIVGGLAARGADPLTAALWGVYLHGEAGRVLANEVGRIGFLARELLDQVPKLLES
ncbi:NAD(P)H-hydrate dehydratase [Sphingosinicella sp. BN140058]|uniref:NAD(P)H-hydrate dehydratase n=1 Tax=Sphingosinicella sp. BN140058 TaxID=1892855 RepID=UPI0010108F6F|nr:NAD(P)H-hydrate dehydratase [Sphingosinicella sp. BN140058]QAY77122.1 NAD(P)H-hydrate dehydratase [Sphingosinicella sp. BN140058]